LFLSAKYLRFAANQAVRSARPARPIRIGRRSAGTYIRPHVRTHHPSLHLGRHPQALPAHIAGIERAAGLEILRPAGAGVLERWPVSKRVNSSKAPKDDETLTQPVVVEAPLLQV
jgi:hypothetical protein